VPRSESSRPVRVLHVLPWVSSGGPEQRRRLLARHLPRERFEQRVLCKELHHAPLARDLQEAGVAVDVIPGTWKASDVRALVRASRVVRSWRPDIIHGAVFEGVVFATLLGRLAGVPHIVVEETGATPTRSWRGHLLMRAASALSERTVAISPFVARYLERHRSVSPGKLVVITNGCRTPRPVDPEERARVRAELGVPEGAVLFGCLGRVFDGHKRFSDAIDALATVEGARLLVVGDGPDLPALRARARERGVDDRTRFVGHQADVAPWLAAMDVFVVPSAYEAFGLVVPEAMTLGLPVIATRVDAFPDIVLEGVTGLLVPPAAPPALAAAMRRLRDDADERRRMGEAGRARAIREYSEQRYVEDVRAFYERLVSEG
jgi:glycosyltransferase involved in cell wall biosynthesis